MRNKKTPVHWVSHFYISITLPTCPPWAEAGKKSFAISPRAYAHSCTKDMVTISGGSYDYSSDI
jgi:hypothetical protein